MDIIKIHTIYSVPSEEWEKLVTPMIFEKKILGHPSVTVRPKQWRT